MYSILNVTPGHTVYTSEPNIWEGAAQNKMERQTLNLVPIRSMPNFEQ